MLFSIMLCLQTLILSSTIHFDAYTTDWTAPGVEIEEIASIDLLEYGETLLIPNNRYNTPHLGCKLCFAERNGEILWRVVILYRDKVVMLQQDSDPVEVYPGYNSCRRASFSSDGRYVFVGADTGAEPDTEAAFSLLT